MIAIRAGQVLTPYVSLSPGVILLEDGKILAIGRPEAVPIPDGCAIVDASDKIVVPGFVDTHTHGREGVYYGESAETTRQLCRSIVKTGVTSLLPTLSGLPPVRYSLETYMDRIRSIRQAMVAGTGGAEILGIHMEGPYLSPAEKVVGAQIPENLRKPSVAELRQMVEASEGTLRKMTLAPELPVALELIEAMSREGIAASAGHSAATYEQVLQAIQAGLSCSTHTYNGMLPLHHRQPGLLGAILTRPEINAELIGDGQHVSAPAMDVLLRCKGVAGVHLVSDHTIWTGIANGHYQDGDRTVVKEDERAYVLGGSLAGGVSPMNAIVRTLVQAVGRTLAEAVQMASANPARVIGALDRKGSLEPGKDADLLVIDEQVNVHLTLVKGQVLYAKSAGPAQR